MNRNESRKLRRRKGGPALERSLLSSLHFLSDRAAAMSMATVDYRAPRGATERNCKFNGLGG